MVRLKGFYGAWLRLYIGCFNSTMVRLKGIIAYNIGCGVGCFNSTMVRLKAQMGGNFVGLLLQFQFHNGSIKGAASAASCAALAGFNSTMVRLKASSKCATKHP